VAGFWTELPAARVVRLEGASPDAIALALEPLPGDAPATVTYRPPAAPSAQIAIEAVLGELDKVAVGLFPAWLPGAEWIDGPGGNGVAAVRTLALRAAAEGDGFGPFLADLAERSLRGGQPPATRFLDGVRAAGLARVIASSFKRSGMALLVPVPEDFPPHAGDVLVAACEHLAFHGRLSVWLSGAIFPAARRLPSFVVRLDPQLVGTTEDLYTARLTPGPQTSYPALAGRPHPASPAERVLDAALARHPWAVGRAWNQTYQTGPLVNPVRLDLLWAAERCVVEIDGPEHCSILRYEADRRRDVDLQLAGFAVLRFTNAQVERELAAVVSRIKQFLDSRRQSVEKG
jgi:Protein of unknown function (DUF559)